MPALVRLLNTLARGHAAPGAPLLARAPRGADGEIVYGSAVWAARAALAGCRTRAARGGADLKKLLLQSLVLLITGAAARHADPALALDVLHSVRDWLLEPGRGGGGGGGTGALRPRRGSTPRRPRPTSPTSTPRPSCLLHPLLAA